MNNIFKLLLEYSKNYITSINNNKETELIDLNSIYEENKELKKMNDYLNSKCNTLYNQIQSLIQEKNKQNIEHPYW